MLVTEVGARPLRSLENVEVSLAEGITTVLGGERHRQDQPARGALLRPHRALLPQLGPPRPDPLRHPPGASRGVRPRPRWRRGQLPRLGQPCRGPAPSARRERGGRGGGAAPPPADRGVPPGPARPRQGPAGGAAAHLDRFVAARWPSRSELRRRFGQVLAQRNAQVARVAAGLAPPGDLDSWDIALAEAAAPLVQARSEAAAGLAAPFAEAAGELGLQGVAGLAYAPRAEGDATELREGLGARRESDLGLGRTGWGPHLDELRLTLDGHPIRRFGSQGQQRIALLALLFAERAALEEAGRTLPLLLLDDVMSEIDPPRRSLLTERLEGPGQTLITAADPASVPAAARGATILMPQGRSGLAAVA